MDWSFNISVVFTGIVIVFLVLIILVLLVWLNGVVFFNIKSSKKQESISNPNHKNTSKILYTEHESEQEIVAAISACIGCIISNENPQKTFRIKKTINNSNENRPIWNTAGIYDNIKQI